MSGVSAPAPVPIAFVMPSFDPGGTERQMIELVRRLDPRRWRVYVACFRSSGAWLSRVAEAASVVEFPVRSFRRIDTLRQARTFARWCRDRGVAVVHTTQLPSNIFGLPAAAVAGVPARIANRREINPGKSAADLVLQRVAYSCAHRIVANCQAAADRLTEVERVPSAKVRVIPNGIAIDASTVVQRRDRLRRVVVVANLRPEKGHDVLLRAVAIVVRTFPDATFDLVGGGPELSSLEALAERLGVRESVRFSGHCEDVAARLAAADICVHPSRSEAFPNAVLEAMAVGLPVIASGVGGVLEVIRDGVTGMIVPPGDHDALARSISRLMSEPLRARSIGDSARAAVSQTYSFDRMTDAFEDLYLRELGRIRLLNPQPSVAAS
jgi:glycosyltransferase involved in cell wall biosynthesis